MPRSKTTEPISDDGLRMAASIAFRNIRNEAPDYLKDQIEKLNKTVLRIVQNQDRKIRELEHALYLYEIGHFPPKEEK